MGNIKRRNSSTRRKKDRKKQENLERKSVSMENFLVRFLGVKDVNLLQSGLTHKDLKSIFPNLKRTGFNTILDDPELVARGEVVLVTDSVNNIVPYSTSNLSIDMSDVMDNEEWSSTELWDKEKNSKNITLPTIHEYELKSLRIYELVTLMELYSRTGQMNCYEIIRRELISRDDSRHASKHSKAKALRKELKRRRKEEDYNY